MSVSNIGTIDVERIKVTTIVLKRTKKKVQNWQKQNLQRRN